MKCQYHWHSDSESDWPAARAAREPGTPVRVTRRLPAPGRVEPLTRSLPVTRSSLPVVSNGSRFVKQ